MELIFILIVLIFSVMIHEVSHGYVAEYLGDPTARLAGRLTFNPLKHIDPFGSVILPAIMALPALFGQPVVILGWAKPVPYNPYNLKNPVSGGAKIAAAGPISNLIIAAVFGLALRFLGGFGFFSAAFIRLFADIIALNIILAIFNLIPIPPLDGSRILMAILPRTPSVAKAFFVLERYGLIIVLILLFSGLFQIILPLVNLIFYIIVGQPSAF